jgi:hypothetical protein
MRKSLFILLLFLCSCASILNPRNQKVILQTGDSNASVFFKDSLIGVGDNVKIKVRRDFATYDYTIKYPFKEDYHFCLIPDHKSPTYLFSIVPFGALIVTPFIDMWPKSYSYKHTININITYKVMSSLRIVPLNMKEIV